MTITVTDAPAQTEHDFLDAFGRRDVAAAVSLATPDVLLVVYPLGVRGTGHEALRPVLADIVGAFPDLRLTVQRVITTGDTVTVLVKVEGTRGRRIRRCHQPGEAPRP